MRTAIISGNLTDKPKKGGTKDNPGIFFTVAVNCPKRDESAEGGYSYEAFFMNCSLFGKRAASLYEKLDKGMRVYVVGDLRPDNYTGKDGAEHKGVSMTVRDIEYQAKRESGNDW